MLVSVLIVSVASPTAYAAKCEHLNKYSEQLEDPTDSINRYNYYHVLKCRDCGAVLSSPVLCYDNDNEATCETQARCDTCGEYFGELPTGHHYKEGYFSYNEKHHYSACLTCSEVKPDTVSEHTFDIWRTTLSATEDRPGERARSCDVCGYVQTEIIPQLEGRNNVGLIILLVIIAILAAAVGVFLAIWLIYYKRTMRDLLECAQALGQDLKNMVLDFFGGIVDFCTIVIKSIALFFTKIRVFFAKVWRRIKGFFQTVGIIFNRCFRAVKNFFDKVREFFENLF